MYFMHLRFLGCVKISRINFPYAYRRQFSTLSLGLLSRRPRAIRVLCQSSLLDFSPTPHDLVAFSGVLASAFIWIKLNGLLTERNIVEKTLGRKLVHITTAPLFVICWIFFSSTNEARYLAAMVPLINLGRTLMTGTGLVKDKDFIQSMTRKGSSEELLLGPTFYAMTLVGITVVFWRSSWISFLTVGILAGGDGMAEIIGRRLGKTKLPYNRDKSVEGSFALIVFGFLLSIGLMWFFQWFGFLSLEWNGQRMPYLWTLVVAVCCAVVESLPLNSKVDDNVSVPITSTLLGLAIELFIQ